MTPSEEDLFAQEQSVLADARRMLTESADASPDDLRDKLDDITRQYERLLRLTRRLTVMSDNSHRELMEITEFKNHLMGMAAHDIRSPVGIILGFSRIMLEDRASFSESHAHFLERIHKTGEGLIQLLDDLLALSQSESGSLTLTREDFDLTRCLRDLAETNRSLAEPKRIQIVEELAEITRFNGDRARLEQVFNNLIGNAIKYSHADTTVTISASLDENGQTPAVIVTVSDQGLGIAPEELDLIFRPFHRTVNKPTGGEKSTGLGLAIVRRIVEAHDGEIRVESVVGEGSRFTVRLPI